MKLYFAGTRMLLRVLRKNHNFYSEWLEKADVNLLDSYALIPTKSIKEEFIKEINNEDQGKGIIDDSTDIETGIDSEIGDDQY
jgi:hypothetical protein